MSKKNKEVTDFVDEEPKVTKYDEKTKSIIILGIYVVIILAIFLMMKFNGGNDTPAATNPGNTKLTITSPNTEDIVALVEKLKPNNYSADLTILTEDEMLHAEIIKEMLTRESVSVRYGETENYYFINDGKYYSIPYKKDATGEELNKKITELKKEPNIYGDFDQTFLSITNIIKLIELNESSVSLAEEEYSIERFKVSAKSALELYNEINGTNYVTALNNYVTVDVNYKEENIYGIKMDLTNLYGKISKSGYKKVNYIYEFENIGQIDLSKFVELIK